MKSLKQHIQESFKIGKNKMIDYLFTPKNKEELQYYICGKFDGQGLNVPYVNAENIIDLSELFRHNMFINIQRKIKYIDVTGWNTSMIRFMMGMFMGLEWLEEIRGLETWNTSNVDDMSVMFYRCLKLKKLDISSWNVSKVFTMRDMFGACHLLESPGDLSNWKTHELTSTALMFDSCNNLTDIGDISNWDMRKVKYLSAMFQDCDKLKFVGKLTKWKLDNINIEQVNFYKNTQLKDEDIHYKLRGSN